MLKFKTIFAALLMAALATTATAQSRPTVNAKDVNATGNITAGGALNLPSKTANFVFAAPSGVPGVPVFRLLTGTDLPAAMNRSGTITLGSTDNAVNLQTNNVTRMNIASDGTFTVANTPNFQLNAPLNVNNTFTGSYGGQHVANTDYIGSDNADCATSFCINSSFQYSFGGAAAKGGRANTYSLLNQTAVTNAANANRNYVADVQLVQTSSGDGGTGLTAATAKGAYFGIGPECVLKSGAVNVFNCTAGEFDVEVEAGASVAYKSVAQFATKPNDRVAGSIVDTMLWAYDQPNGSSPRHKFGLLFGGPDTVVQWPFDATGTIIGAQNSGGTVNALNGVDFSAVTIGGCAFKSGSYCVGGAGAVGATSTTLTGTTPFVTLHDSSAGADIKRWRTIAASGNYFLQTQNDAGSVSTNAYQINAATGVGPQSHTWFTSTVAGSPVQQAALTSSSMALTPKLTTPAVMSTGTQPTSSGTCAASSFVGGATAGRFTTASLCTAGQVITLNFSQTATNGWACQISNMLHTTTTAFNLSQSAYTTTSASFQAATMPSAADTITFNCQGF